MFRSRLAASPLIILALAAFVGGQEKKDQPKEPPKDPPKVDGKRFEPRFEKDKKFYQESVTKLIQVVKVQGQDLTQNQESTFYFEWTPLKQEGDKWVVKEQVQGVKMKIDISGNVINYDSTKDDNAGTGNPGLVEFFKKLKGAEFTATIDKNYKVEKVDGKKAFIDGLASGSPQMEGLLNKVLTEDALKDMCDPSYRLVPQEGGKKVGDAWKREGTVNLGPIGSYKIAYDFKYVGVEKDMDKIEVQVNLDYTVPPKEAGDGLLFRIVGGKLGVPMGADGKTPDPGKGTILYDPKAGRVASAEITVKLKGELTVAIGGTETKVELNQEQVTSIKTADASLIPQPKK